MFKILKQLFKLWRRDRLDSKIDKLTIKRMSSKKKLRKIVARRDALSIEMAGSEVGHVIGPNGISSEESVHG